MRVSRGLLAFLIMPLLTLAAPVAMANHRTDLTSAFDEGNPYDFNVKLGYTRTLKRGAIKREKAGTAREAGITVDNELRYTQVRHILSVRAEAALFRDLQLHFELPIVLSDVRTLNFAQNEGDSCVNSSLPKSDPDPTKVQGVWNNCVVKENSSLVKDGFFPNQGQNIPSFSPGIEIAGPDGLNGGFTLPERKGLDQLYLGLTWAPLNQRRDNTKPTWTIGFEARIAVGDQMEYNPWTHDSSRSTYTITDFIYDPKKANENTAVGQGLHQFHFFMSLSRRFKYVDPWLTFFYLLPVPAGGSQYERTTFANSGQERHEPQQRGGGMIGLEIIPWEDPVKDMKIGIELFGKLEGVFEGRGYSEMWEVFANNPTLNGPCRRTSYNGKVDTGLQKWQNGSNCEDSATNDYAYIAYPGISSIENHAVFQGGLMVNAQLTKWVWAEVGVALAHEQQHYITFGDAGKDKNKNGSIERFYPTPTEISDVNAGKVPAPDGPYDEINPMYRPYIDSVGRRFRVGETTIFDVMVNLKGMF